MKRQPMTPEERAEAIAAIGALIEANNAIHEASLRASHQLGLGFIDEARASVAGIREAVLRAATITVESVVQACEPRPVTGSKTDTAKAGEAAEAMQSAAEIMFDDLSGLREAIATDPTADIGMRAEAVVQSLAVVARHSEQLFALVQSRRQGGNTA